jgi:nicotinate-nucleotide adenylyltransferase
MNTERCLGVMGGAFNPVHLGHLAAAEEARQLYHLDEVLFVPCGDPPWPKEEALADSELRFAMVAQAIADHPQFRLSRQEIERQGPSYTVDTLRSLQVQRPERRLFLIVGMDAAQEFAHWRGPEVILTIAELLVVVRPPYRTPKNAPLFRHPQVHLIETPGVAISSTQIRERVSTGRSIRFLVPPLVAETIFWANLYR